MSANINNNISTEEKIEILKHTIDRYDHYFDSINNKGNLFLTLNTFLLGGMITGYYSIKDNIVGQNDIIFFCLDRSLSFVYLVSGQLYRL